jgi:dinuclear metal center YbgI/SA1388 family protein
MKRDELARYLDETLETARFRDYCPNGLQVEGRAEVQHIVAGVTASQALIEAAIERRADALLVHHGWFWKGEDGRITGLRKARISRLLAHDINLFAYHLPLDSHAELGNNAQLAARLGWIAEARFGEQDIAWIGRPASPLTAGELAQSIAAKLGRVPQLVGDPARPIGRIAWCSGGAQGYFEQAIALGVDAYVSGEISEQTVHLARESGVAYLAAGHHATERFGAEALAQHLAEKFGLSCEFVDIDNPV